MALGPFGDFEGWIFQGPGRVILGMTSKSPEVKGNCLGVGMDSSRFEGLKVELKLFAVNSASLRSWQGLVDVCLNLASLAHVQRGLRDIV